MEETYEDYSQSNPVVSNVWKTLGFILLASLAVGIVVEFASGTFHNIPLFAKFQLFMSSALGRAVSLIIIPLLIAGFSRVISSIRKKPKSNLTKTLWISWGIIAALSTLGQF